MLEQAHARRRRKSDLQTRQSALFQTAMEMYVLGILSGPFKKVQRLSDKYRTGIISAIQMVNGKTANAARKSSQSAQVRTVTVKTENARMTN